MTNYNDQLQLIHVTDRDLIDFTRFHNSGTWKGFLSVEDFILREYVLNKSPHCDNIMIFLLLHGNDKVCSCELLIRDGIKFERNKEITVSTGCISAVYTYQEFRSKGYAKIMIDRVIEQCKILLDGFVFLYSEIGEYYTRLGFKSFHVPMLTREVSGDAVHFKGDNDIVIDGNCLQFVRFHQFKELIDLYKKYNYHEIRQKVAKDGKTRISIDVHERIFDWFHLRAKFLTYKATKLKVPIDFTDHDDTVAKFNHLDPKNFGLKISVNGNVKAYIIWTYDFKADATQYLTVLNLFAVPGYESYKLKLLRYTEDYMKLLGISTLKIWSSDIDNKEFNGKVSTNPSLGAIRMITEEDDKRLESGEIIWENNNKIPWF